MKKQNGFPFVMKSLTAGFGLLTLVLFAGNQFQVTGWLGACAITCLTFFYHLTMRLLVGALVPAHLNPQSKWFHPKPWEQRLYRRIQLHKWKRFIPTYDPGSFSLATNTPKQLLEAMCRSEVVHESIAVCSFLPILLSIFWGEFPVFLLTSLVAALVDLVFVALQRYNRPRLERLLQKQNPKEELL